MLNRVLKAARAFLPLISCTALNSMYLLKENHQDSNAQQLANDHLHLHLPHHRLPTLPSPTHLTIAPSIDNFLELYSLSPNTTIVVYELTGDKNVDQQVIDLIKGFVQEKADAISQGFEFVLINEKIAGQQESGPIFAVISPTYPLKSISLKPYINVNQGNLKTNLPKLYSELQEKINQYKQVGIENLHAFYDKLAVTDSAYVVAHGGSSEECKKLLDSFSKGFIEAGVKKIIVRDDHTQRILGLSHKQSNSKPKLTVIAPQSQNIVHGDSIDYYSIGDRQFTKFDPSDLKSFVFPPLLTKSKDDPNILHVLVDKNKQSSDLFLQKVYEVLRHPSFANIQKRLVYAEQDQPINLVYLRKDYINESVEAYKVGTQWSKEQIKSFLHQSFQWRYPIPFSAPSVYESINADSILAWINEIKANPSANQYYKSEKAPPLRNSIQIVGQEYREVLNSNEDKVVFHYSTHCHSCKRFGGVFEEIAGEMSNFTKFYRFNNDHNKAEGVKNYDSTPVFAYYKQGIPNPFIYKFHIFTKTLFENFIKITSEVKAYPFSIIDHQISQRRKSDGFLKQFDLIN